MRRDPAGAEPKFVEGGYGLAEANEAGKSRRSTRSPPARDGRSHRWSGNLARMGPAKNRAATNWAMRTMLSSTNATEFAAIAGKAADNLTAPRAPNVAPLAFCLEPSTRRFRLR